MQQQYLNDRIVIAAVNGPRPGSVEFPAWADYQHDFDTALASVPQVEVDSRSAVILRALRVVRS